MSTFSDDDEDAVSMTIFKRIKTVNVNCSDLLNCKLWVLLQY